MRSTRFGAAAALLLAACATSTASRTVREDAGEVALADARAAVRSP